MSYRKRHRITPWKVLRRCVIFFTTICVIPVFLVLLVMTDQYMRPNREGGLPFTHSEVIHRSPNAINSRTILGTNGTLIETRIFERKKHLKTMCGLLGLDVPGNDSLHKPNPWEFLINNKYHLIWCNVFKAGSTSWMYNFNLLAGYSPNFLKKSKTVPLTLARQRYPRPSLGELKEAFNDSVSFFIVRHPLERLLSAYRDKIEYSLPHTYHRKLGSEIISKYRSQQDKSAPKKINHPTFSEFVSYLLNTVKEGEVLDMHWTPITDFCTPCMFDFDVIAHMETLKDDQLYIIYKAGLQNIIKPEWKNQGHGTASDQIQSYYSQLTRAQILQLYHIYRYDFELFNYSLEGYLEIGKPDEDPSALLAAITMRDMPKYVRYMASNTHY